MPPNAEANRTQARERSRKQSEDVRDIGKLPRVVNRHRRNRCKADLADFLRTYFPATFILPFSADQLSVIAKTQQVIAKGGLHAVGMPRGSGKTAIAEGAVLYAILYGFRRFVMFIGATSSAATESLDSIKRELEDNELLLADFPEAVYPIHCLEGEPRRCKGQTYKGKRTLSRWGMDEIVMPTMPKSPASGAIVRVAGITGRIRGQKFKRPDGVTQRPDLVLPDDIQTDDSAMSEIQCVRRERTLAGAVLGLAGPKRKISGIAPMTVIRAGDVADRLLDPKIHPEWNGSRHKMMYSWPSNMDLWLKYKEVFLSYNPSIKGDGERAAAAATAFYAERRAEMDAGASVAWAERFNDDEISALQHAMNFWIRDARAFAAEGQGEPLPEEDVGAGLLTAEQLAAKLNGYERRQVPLAATTLTAMIDVQKDILFYAVVAWEPNFTGYIIDYGSFPDQSRPYFSIQDIDRTLAWATKVQGLEGQLYAGLMTLTDKILGVEYNRGGGQARIERCFVDANWGQSTDVVYQACRASAHAAILMPSHGKGIGASATPMAAWPKKPGERRDPNGMWIITQAPQRREIRYTVYDTNAAKSFVHSRFGVAMGGIGCLSLWGRDAGAHRMVADHCLAEYPVRTTAKGREVDEWKLKPNRDNHWFDCLVGATVAASMQGASLEEMRQPIGDRAKGRTSWAKMKAQAETKPRT